jgi:hypothetical protein
VVASSVCSMKSIREDCRRERMKQGIGRLRYATAD